MEGNRSSLTEQLVLNIVHMTGELLLGVSFDYVTLVDRPDCGVWRWCLEVVSGGGVSRFTTGEDIFLSKNWAYR